MNAIIFDFDGTIADSFAIFVDVMHEITGVDGRIDSAELQRLRKMRIREIIRDLRIPLWKTPLLMIQGRRKIGKRLGEIKPFAGMQELIIRLHAEGYQLFIMSSNSKTNVDTFLAGHGVADYFHAVYGGVGLLGKPRVLKRILKDQQLPKETTSYVGDEVRDIEASKAVGIPCFAVAWGFNTPEALAKHNPSVLVATPAALQQALEDWGRSR